MNKHKTGWAYWLRGHGESQELASQELQGAPCTLLTLCIMAELLGVSVSPANLQLMGMAFCKFFGTFFFLCGIHHHLLGLHSEIVRVKAGEQRNCTKAVKHVPALPFWSQRKRWEGTQHRQPRKSALPPSKQPRDCQEAPRPAHSKQLPCVQGLPVFLPDPGGLLRNSILCLQDFKY